MQKKGSKKASENKSDGRWINFQWFPLLVLILSLAVTFLVWNYSRKRVEKETHLYFEQQTVRTEEAVTHAIGNYIDTLYDVQGLFVAADEVSRPQWNNFAASLNLKKRFPGIHNLSFSPYVPGDKKELFEKKIRKELRQESLAIYPPGDRPDYFPIEFMVFSESEKNDFGLDIGGDAVRREELEKAIKSGEPRASGKIFLKSTNKNGFCIRLPVYRSGMPHDTEPHRRAALVGIVSIVLLMDEFVDSIIEKNSRTDIDFEIFDLGAVDSPRSISLIRSNPAQFLFYDDDGKTHLNHSTYHPLYDKLNQLDIAGERWLFYFVTRPQFKFGSENYFPVFILIAGLMISGLLFGMTWTLVTSQARAEELAGAMTADLRESEKRFHQKNAFVQLLYVVSVAANESSSLEEALQTCLNEICGHMGWSVGHVYFKSEDEEQKLYPSAIWYFDQPSDFVHFRVETEKTLLDWKEGLPGMVLESGEPVCIPLISLNTNLPRYKVAMSTGIQSGFAIPLLVKDEVVAVLEFYSRKMMEQDASTLEVMAHIGTQLGRVIERKKAKEQLDYMATHDPLSHLPNRALFSDRLEHAIASAKRNNSMAAVLFVDLDQFKRINDTLGHTMGDIALREVAKRLHDCVRTGDTVARWGGDEFTLLFENITKVQNLKRICQKVLDAISKPIHIGGKELHLSTSIGITISPLDGDNAELLLKNADIAMYRAKEKGRNNFQFYSQEMSADTSQKLELENQLRHAIERNEFLLFYQPFIDLKSDKIVGAEALIRWNHPVQGMISPAKFIPLAEETGLIVPIGDWVLNTACAQNKAWQEMGLPPIRVAINLSARQFQQSGVVEKIKRILKESGLSPWHLELELTESILMQKTDEMISMLGQLHEMGIHISIDDFGTGYSSLSYIKKFPIDTLKIDQSFVREITTNKDDAALSTAIIAMAHSLNLKVIAEAVETVEQLEFFKSRSCNEIQGYYISPPLSPEVFRAFLTERNFSSIT